MVAESGDVRLQVLLRPASRNDEGMAAVRRGLRALGLEVTGAGRVTVSARATAAVFVAAFGEASREPGAVALPVPSSLVHLVESITVASRHVSMSGRDD
jgi:hypothetical protein